MVLRNAGNITADRRPLGIVRISSADVEITGGRGTIRIPRIGLYMNTREEPVYGFALISRPIKTRRMLKLLFSTNQIFRQEKQRKTLTLFYYKILSHRRERERERESERGGNPRANKHKNAPATTQRQRQISLAGRRNTCMA